MKPVLKWQYDQMVKELLLLQEHAANPSCPCETDGEMCRRKHLMTLEAYAEETLVIEKREEFKDMLRRIGQEAKQRRMREEDSLCGEDVPAPLAEWTRDWRKELEKVSLACDNDASGEEKEDPEK